MGAASAQDTVALLTVVGLYVVLSIIGVVVNTKRDQEQPSALIPTAWSGQNTVRFVLTSELVTMAAWTAVLVAAPQPAWVMELAIAAQSLLLVWIAIVLLTRDRFVTTLTWISGIAMLPYAAVAVGAKGPWVLLVLVYLHTAHRIIIDGWWIYAVRAEAAP